MRRPALAALCAASALAISIPASIGLTAVSTDDQASRPLSQIPKVERFGQAALDAQAQFLARMPQVQVRYGENGAVSMLTGRTGIFLPSGLNGFKVGQPSKELLAKVGPALLAAGTEELRVVRVHRQAGRVQPNSPERTVLLSQYIRGREVQLSAVNIRINQETNEITLLKADFLPDRGLQHEPTLTAAQARAKVEAAMRESGLEPHERIVFEDTPAHLAYAFEDIGDNGGIGGLLVWVFEGRKAESGDELRVSVSARTGEVVRFHSLTAGLLNRISYTANNTSPPSAGFPGGLTLRSARAVIRPTR